MCSCHAVHVVTHDNETSRQNYGPMFYLINSQVSAEGWILVRRINCERCFPMLQVIGRTEAGLPAVDVAKDSDIDIVKRIGRIWHLASANNTRVL